MRLGQLARKLSLRPIEIVEFLAKNNIQIGDGSNTRIEDEHAMIVIKHFAPGHEELLKEEDEVSVPAPVESAIESNITEAEPPAIAEETNSTAEVSEAQIEENKREEMLVPEGDIIKAPKVELPGLKVIGKIDLPEPKKKEEPATPGLSDEKSESTESGKATAGNVRERRRPHQNRERREFRPRKNPIALQRELEAQEAEKKRRAEKEREKERRTANYHKKIKPAQPTKAARLVNEQVVELNEAADDKPKSLLMRFFHWLTGK